MEISISICVEQKQCLIFCVGEMINPQEECIFDHNDARSFAKNSIVLIGFVPWSNISRTQYRTSQPLKRICSLWSNGQ